MPAWPVHPGTPTLGPRILKGVSVVDEGGALVARSCHPGSASVSLNTRFGLLTKTPRAPPNPGERPHWTNRASPAYLHRALAAPWLQAAVLGLTGVRVCFHRRHSEKRCFDASATPNGAVVTTEGQQGTPGPQPRGRGSWWLGCWPGVPASAPRKLGGCTGGLLQGVLTCPLSSALQGSLPGSAACGTEASRRAAPGGAGTPREDFTPTAAPRAAAWPSSVPPSDCVRPPRPASPKSSPPREPEGREGQLPEREATASRRRTAGGPRGARAAGGRARAQSGRPRWRGKVPSDQLPLKETHGKPATARR